MNSNEVVPCGKMKFFNIWKFSNCWLLTWKLMDELDQISPGSAFFSFRLRVHYGQNFTNFVKATDLEANGRIGPNLSWISGYTMDKILQILSRLLTWKLMDELDQISPGSAFFSFRLRVHYGQNFTNFVKATDLKLMDELDQISPGSAGTLWTKFYKFCQGY
ncbi:uncharacterized protein LOC119611717 isoform X2 [Lucilia sericata]|uniref:uncharacterized protein LOC119611717 isoform X2 n=1 Tax=Lucilia sericata TaxID=13632 RepID=UPI0018A81172|nr:uncharacterized protein LOC119611717 isoform X2 [Lucilia sericata]